MTRKPTNPPVVSPYANVKSVYRITEEVQSNGYMDEFGNWHYWCPTLQLFIKSYNVIRATPCGVWIIFHGDERFINLTCTKCFAYDTIKRAVESYKCRKRRQVHILSTQLKTAETALAMIDKIDVDATTNHVLSQEAMPRDPNEFYSPDYKTINLQFQQMQGFELPMFGSLSL